MNYTDYYLVENMKVLNCENDDTIFESLKEITGINKREFLSMFNQFKLDECL